MGRSSFGYEYPGTNGDCLLGLGSLREVDQSLSMSETYEKFGAAQHIHKLANFGGYYRFHLCGSRAIRVLDSNGFEDCRLRGSKDHGLQHLRDHWPIGCGYHNLLSGYDSHSQGGSLREWDQNSLTSETCKKFGAVDRIDKLAGSWGY